jgi:hypothetical protein
LGRARALPEAAWKAELVRRYQEALRNYAREYLGGNEQREKSR